MGVRLLGTYDLLKAQPSEAVEVVALLVEAARWLQSRGIAQWGWMLEPEQQRALAAEVAAGATYLAWREGRPVGTVRLLLEPGEWDHGLWGAAAAEPAAYVHRLAVARSEAGRGLGAALLAWAEAEARRQGKGYLRLDCLGANGPLNAYYRRWFTYVGQAEVARGSFSKFEKQL